MARPRGSRKWVPLACGLALSACGGDEEKPAAGKAAPAADNALVKRCSLKVADGNGGFPPGLLPAGSVVTGEGYAIAPGKLGDVFQALQSGAADAGLEVRDSEIETFDAELELEGPDGEFGLALSPRRGCDGAVEVRLRD
jgi:hypothetical protein